MTSTMKVTDSSNAATSLLLPSFTWTGELKIIALISLKIGFANILELLPQFAATAFIGRLPDTTRLLAGCGMATQFAAITGTVPAWGFCSALFTLAPQCLGAGKRQLLALYWQRCCYISVWALILSSTMQLFGADILIYIGLPIELYPILNSYCRALIPFIWGMGALTSLQRIGQAIDINTELFWVVFVGAASCIPLNYFFVYYCKLGAVGTALTIDAAMWLDVICCIIIMIRRGYGFIFIPQKISLIANWDGIKEYLALAIPGLFQQGLVWWINQVNVVLCGFIHRPQLAVSVTVVCTMLNMILSMISIGIANAVNLRVAQYIGASQMIYGKRVAKIGFAIDVLWLLFMMIIVIAFRHPLTTLWTNDENVIPIASQLTIVVAIYQCCFNIFRVLAGVYSALGYPLIAAVVVFMCQYVIALTCILLLLMYFKWRDYTIVGIYTVWGGSVVGLSLTSIVLVLLLIVKIDWKDAVSDAQARIAKSMAYYGSFSSCYIQSRSNLHLIQN